MPTGNDQQAQGAFVYLFYKDNYFFNYNKITMAETVIGVFEQRTKAIKAVDKLLRDGFHREAIDISSDKTGDYNRKQENDTSGIRQDRTHHTEGDTGHKSGHHHSESDKSINKFFDSLFGTGDKAREHSEVGRRGTIVTVHTRENDMSKKASAILDEHGSVDVRDHARQYLSKEDHNGNGKDTSTHKDFGSDHSNPVASQRAGATSHQGESSQSTGIRSHIVGKQVDQDIRLRDEETHESPYRNSDKGENSAHLPSSRPSSTGEDTTNRSDVEDHHASRRNQVDNATTERESIYYSDEEEKRNIRNSEKDDLSKSRIDRPNHGKNEDRRNADDYQAPTEAEQARYERERRRDQ